MRKKFYGQVDQNEGKIREHPSIRYPSSDHMTGKSWTPGISTLMENICLPLTVEEEKTKIPTSVTTPKVSGVICCREKREVQNTEI